MAFKVHSALALATLGVGVGFFACGPSASDDEPITPAATSSVVPVTSAPATTTAAVTTGETPPPAAPNACDGPGDTYVSQSLNSGICETTAPPNCLINEFATNFMCPETPGVGECGDCCWGDDTSLSGGPISYQGESSEITYTHGTDSVIITGTSADYAGFGLWFGPCTDASTWDGLEIQVTGDLGGGQLFVQLQTDENYPIEDGKGACDWAAAGATEAEKWNVCSNAQVEVTGVTVDGLTPYRFKWADFSGGKPNTGAPDPRQLRGIQVQIGCAPPEAEGDAGASSAPAAPCAFNLELHDLRWYKEEAL